MLVRTLITKNLKSPAKYTANLMTVVSVPRITLVAVLSARDSSAMATARMALATCSTTQFPLLLTLPHSNFIRNGEVLRTASAAAPIAHSFSTTSWCSCPFSFSLATPRFKNLAILARAAEVGSENSATEAKPGDIAVESKSGELPTGVEATEAESGDIATESQTEDLATEVEAEDDATEVESGGIATQDLATEGDAQDAAPEAESKDIALEVESEVPPENQGLKLYVGNLPWSCDSTQLAETCQELGVVDTVEVVFDQETGRSRGFAFVTMASNEDARAVLKALHGSELGGRTLKVDFPRPTLNNPRIVNYPPSPRGRPGNINKVFVGNFPWACDDEALTLLFSGYGKVVDARVVYDRETGRSRGFGFVTMGSAAEMNAVIENLNGVVYEGRELIVSLVEEKKSRPPSQ